MYRACRNYENIQRRLFDGIGPYDIPQIEPEQYDHECEWISFNHANSADHGEGKGIHFFIDDYQFNRIWTAPDRYIPLLGKYEYVMSPDFSLYSDFPKAVQIYNHYRKHWVAAYLQENGIKVIPSIAWSDSDSFAWCFDGEPKGGAVAVSSVGCMKNELARRLFVNGYQEMIKCLIPSTIIFYGAVPEGCGGNIVNISAFHEKFDCRRSKWADAAQQVG